MPIRGLGLKVQVFLQDTQKTSEVKEMKYLLALRGRRLKLTKEGLIILFHFSISAQKNEKYDSEPV